MDSTFLERLSDLEIRFRKFKMVGTGDVLVGGSLKSGFAVNINRPPPPPPPPPPGGCPPDGSPITIVFSGVSINCLCTNPGGGSSGLIADDVSVNGSFVLTSFGGGMWQTTSAGIVQFYNYSDSRCTVYTGSTFPVGAITAICSGDGVWLVEYNLEGSWNAFINFGSTSPIPNTLSCGPNDVIGNGGTAVITF
jgi:hypothetical protein